MPDAPTHEPPPAAAERQAAFLPHLPLIEAHARRAFRRLRCPFDREDAVAEAVAFAWSKFRALPGHVEVSAPELAGEAVADVRSQMATPAAG